MQQQVYADFNGFSWPLCIFGVYSLGWPFVQATAAAKAAGALPKQIAESLGESKDLTSSVIVNSCDHVKFSKHVKATNSI